MFVWHVCMQQATYAQLNRDRTGRPGARNRSSKVFSTAFPTRRSDSANSDISGLSDNYIHSHRLRYSDTLPPDVPERVGLLGGSAGSMEDPKDPRASYAVPLHARASYAVPVHARPSYAVPVHGHARPSYAVPLRGRESIGHATPHDAKYSLASQYQTI